MKSMDFCHGCAFHCHLNCGSDAIIELDLKNNFCCDCGTKKSPIPCHFTKTEEEINERKKITNTNENDDSYQGIFCWCKKRYDDKDFAQCQICMNWYHFECIAKKGFFVPSEIQEPTTKTQTIEDIESDFICSDCNTKYPILLNYLAIFACTPSGELYKKEEKK